jgi:hypothetical protein
MESRRSKLEKVVFEPHNYRESDSTIQAEEILNNAYRELPNLPDSYSHLA